MDEYTALQKYILFYRDTRTNPHAEQTTKKKAWWQFWKSGSATAATPIQDAGAVPDDCKFYHPAHSIACTSITSHCCLRQRSTYLANSSFVELYLDIWWLAWSALKLFPASNAIAAEMVEPIMQPGSTKLPASAASEMSNTIKRNFANMELQTSTLSSELVSPRPTLSSVASAMVSTKSLLRRPTFSSSSSVTSLVPFSTVRIPAQTCLAPN